jgi:predicted alpha/beta hydrolase family esterase
MLPYVTRILLVPGRSVPTPEHWQSRWAREHSDYRWAPRPGEAFDIPERVDWLQRILAEDAESALLVAHSGGCLVVAHWAAQHTGPVRGALLVAPPVLDPDWTPGPDDPPGTAPLPDTPRDRLPFSTIVVASRTDPHAAFDDAAKLAEDWGARLIDAGDAGHIDTASGYGSWPAGEALLGELR